MFYDREDPNGLSEDAYHFIGGLLKHARGMTAITNPTVNSYKRLVPGYEAPVHIAWATSNRSPLIRIPFSKDEGKRIELRHPDPSCNPYLALAVMLRCGMDGIKNRIEPPPAVDRNIYKMTDENLAMAGIQRLPSDIDEAVDEMMADEVICGALGKHVTDTFVKAKRIEWDSYTRAVHAWETERYF